MAKFSCFISLFIIFINDFHFILAAINLKDLRRPGMKMSKAEGTDRGRINLTDTPDVMLSKIRKAVTDMTSKITYEPETRPGVSNLVAIHSAVTNKNPEELCQEAANLDTDKYVLHRLRHSAPFSLKLVELTLFQL